MSTARSVDEHVARILAAVEPGSPKQLPLPEALGRTLAETVTTSTAIPPFDNSAMDGYAVRHADVLAASPDTPVNLPVVGDLPAGSPDHIEVGPGRAARIMTGAPLPPGADTVVPLEQTDSGLHRVSISSPAAPGAHIRREGEDLQRGDVVLEPGVVLQSRHLAAIASAGRDRVLTFTPPRVAIIATGSELVPPGQRLRHGQIPDSNSLLLAAAVVEAGAEAMHLGIIADDEDLLRETIVDRADDVDAMILSGGVSVGAFDVVKAVLAPLGIEFSTVRMQPGKPQGFGRWSNGVPIFALPGNPVSAAVSFEVFVRPALRRMQGRRDVSPRLLRAFAAEGWTSPVGRRQFMPVTLLTEPRADTAPRVRPATAGGSRSHLVASLALADGLAVISESTERVSEGDRIDVMLLGPE